MVRNYVRKSHRAQYSENDIAAALSEIRSGNMSTKRASVVFNINRTTLIKRMKKPGSCPENLGRFKKVFTIQMECELVMHIVDMQQRFYGLSLSDLRSLAYEFAERNGIKHPFSTTERRAGRDWTMSFMKRYPELSLRRPEATSMSRLSGFNKIQVGRFFDVLKGELEKKKFSAKQVFNIDETGITSVQTPGKIIARRGSKQVGRVVSAEKGCTTTVVCGMNAAGVYVPPMFLFKRKNMNNLLMKHCPAGAVGVPSPSGWMDSALFITYLKHFITCVKPSRSNPVLVILDGHQSHKSIDAVELARENYITLVTIPPHTSHRLQPLDLTFFGPVKKAYNREVDKWMTRYPGRRVTDYDLCELFTPAYQRAASIEKAVNGFKCSGIFPLNPDVFDDEDFAPSSVTEIPNPHEPTASQAGQQSTQNEADIEPLTPANSKQRTDSSGVNMPAAAHVTIEEISPLPRAAHSSSKSRKRKAEAAMVLTSTPNKRALEEKQRERQCPKMAARKKIMFKQTENCGSQKAKSGGRKTARKQTAHKAVMKSAKASAKQASTVSTVGVSGVKSAVDQPVPKRKKHLSITGSKVTKQNYCEDKTQKRTTTSVYKPRQPVWLQQYKESRASIHTGSKAVTETSVETVAEAVADLPEQSGCSADEVTDNSVQQRAVTDQVQASSPILEIQTTAQPVTVHSSEQPSAKPTEESISVEVAEVDSRVTSQALQSNDVVYTPLVETAFKSSNKPDVVCTPVATSSFYGHKQKGRPAVDKGHADVTVQTGSRSKRSHHLPSRFRE